MKLAIVLCLVGVSLSAPQFNRRQQSFSPRVRDDLQTTVLVDERNGPDEFGNFNYRFETSDGTFHESSGTPTGQDIVTVQGSYRFLSPEGETVEVRYIADENGFRAESPFLPTPPPMPRHALEQIRAAEEAFARQRQNPAPQTIRNNRPNRPNQRTFG